MLIEEIRSLLTAKASALVNRSPEALAALLSDGFIYLNASGMKFDKNTYIDTYCSSGKVNFKQQKIEDLQVSPFADFSVATLIANDQFEIESRLVVQKFRSFCVFERTQGGWRWAGGQTTSIG